MLPFEKLPYIFFQPLIEIKVLVTAVFLQHDGYIDLTVFVTRQFIAELFAMLCQAFNFLLAFTAKTAVNVSVCSFFNSGLS